MLDLCAINISNIIELDELSEFTTIISTERMHKVTKYRYTHNKVQSILAEVLLRYQLNLQCEIKNSEVKFRYNDYGKPYLSMIDKVHFNLSHSGDWVVCGICDNPIGIDVEKINEKDNSYLWDCLSKEEYGYILKQPREKQKDCFYKMWTLKESYIKYIGYGLSIPLKSFSCHMSPNDISSIHDSNSRNKPCLKTERIDSKHYVSVCFNDNYQDRAGNINIIMLQQLKEWLKTYL